MATATAPDTSAPVVIFFRSWLMSIVATFRHRWGPNSTPTACGIYLLHESRPQTSANGPCCLSYSPSVGVLTGRGDVMPDQFAIGDIAVVNSERRRDHARTAQ
jgi:hypothetical protein